jgi:predicted nuclease of restriction endonuclease-like (RecB) superfamily
MISELGKNYGEVLQSLKLRIQQARLKATLAVNKELLQVYWEIGDTILRQQKNEGWGAKVIDRLAADLKSEFPDMKGLSLRNIKYMRAFAEVYPDFTIVQQAVAQLPGIENEELKLMQRLVAQLPWGQNCVLLDKLKETDKRLFYAQKAVQNGWSRDMLLNQIESQLHKRQGALTNNFEVTLPKYESEFAVQL